MGALDSHPPGDVMAQVVQIVVSNGPARDIGLTSFEVEEPALSQPVHMSKERVRLLGAGFR